MSGHKVQCLNCDDSGIDEQFQRITYCKRCNAGKIQRIIYLRQWIGDAESELSQACAELATLVDEQEASHVTE